VRRTVRSPKAPASRTAEKESISESERLIVRGASAVKSSISVRVNVCFVPTGLPAGKMISPGRR
jgi:hypothetical protein